MTADGGSDDPRPGADRETGRAEPRVIAHRGFAGAAPENTLAAFRAVADGTHEADRIELDVVACADGSPVVFHDAHLDEQGSSRGITDGTGLVWETSRRDLGQVSVLDSGEPVPSLRTVLEEVPDDTPLNVELKNPGTFDLEPGVALTPNEIDDRRARWDPFVDGVLDLLDAEPRDVLVSSFSETALAAMHDAAPEIPLAPLFWDSIEDGLTIADRYDCEALHPPVNMIAGTPYFERPRHLTEPSFANVDLVSAAEERGCDLNVWTVRTWQEAYHMRAAGVDGLISDYPDLLQWDHAR